MSVLQARGLALRFAQEQPLFHAVNFEINPGDRIALVGPNGAGKSSLLRILAGELEADAGTIVRRRGLVVAYFAQQHVSDSREQGGDWDIESVLRGLGYEELDRLSAGQRNRAMLARALTQPADLLLLDEPTNHLDEKARKWLEHFLLRHQCTCLFVSHDEDFLNGMATRVFSIRRGEFVSHSGSYRDYQAHMVAAESRSWADFEGEQKRLAAFERAAQRRDALARKVAEPPPGARYSQDFYNRKAAKVARTGRLLRERIPEESRAAKPWEDQPIPKLDFLNCGRAGDPPVAIRNVTISYGGPPVIAAVSAVIRRGERWAIRGPNGCGKTTLFRAIREELTPISGAIELGYNVKLGYFAQEAETLRLDDSPLGACLEFNPDRTWIRTLLSCLKLPRTLAEVPIAQLSLGERAKTALAQILVSGANVLLLDEPTNHLEIEARHALIETLVQFPGTILFVSHDDAFIEAIATHTLELGV